MTHQSLPDGRARRLHAAATDRHDVLIVGGGVNGARLYDLLCRRGQHTLLLDAGDFASGTSQASGMMVWGGLLYLRQGDVATAWKLCRARERLLATEPELTAPTRFRYCPGQNGSARAVLTGLGVYWMFGGCNRQPPRLERDYPEAALLASPAPSLTYEEGRLARTDCRFVLEWILRHDRPHQSAINYCAVDGAGYDRAERLWRVRVRDLRGGREFELKAAQIVNCAGVWTDRVNALCGIRSPVKHAFSKGVYAAFTRPESHDLPLIFETGADRDVITSVPFGPVALWGPTETKIEDLEAGFRATAADVRFLMAQRRRCLKEPGGVQDIVSLRAGVRPLAVPADFAADVYPLTLSRRHQVVADRDVPFVSTYGGKFTGSLECAEEVWAALRARLPARGEPAPMPPPAQPPAPKLPFPGLAEPALDPEWCRLHEQCCTLEDYLRRRTDIAQWVPRGGLGRADEHLPRLRVIAHTLAGGDPAIAEADLGRYRKQIEREFDQVLDSI